MTDVLRGYLEFFSETGTEGAFWAFQDEQHIRVNVEKGYCRKCGKWLDAGRDLVGGGKITIERTWVLDQETIDYWNRTGELPEKKDCPEGEHEHAIGEAHDPEGFHILKDGDRLTIYERATDGPLAERGEMVWEGTVRLKEFPPFREHAFGYWIHSDQEGVERDRWARWFIDGHPADLEPAPERPRRR